MSDYDLWDATGDMSEWGDVPYPVRRFLAEASGRLAAAGVGSPRVDAELMAAHVLGVPRGRLLAVEGIDAEQRTTLEHLVASRARRVPLQHLLGTAPFRYLELAVGPGVFVPRPETELLVEWGLSVLPSSAVVVDLCSGSGAIALAVATEAASSTVHAVEADPDALAWLRRNLSGRAVRVVAGDATDPDVLADLDGIVDLVLCNPPYVPLAAPVPPEVADHDPATAVFGGPDGLDVIRGIVPRAATLLRPGGHVGIEHDETHAAEVAALLRDDGRYIAVTTHPDLAGRPRFASACRGPVDG